MSIAATITYRWQWIAIILLTLALAATTTLTILYATSGSSDDSGRTMAPSVVRTHDCYRPSIPC